MLASINNLLGDTEMVLSLMRKHAKSWLIKFMIGMIAVVFIFYFGYSFRSRQGVKVAMVNGEPISGLEYQKTYRTMLESLQREYKDYWNENLIKVFDLENRALQDLINQKLLSQEAKRIGLEVTEEEIQNEIMRFPAFQYNGQFDVNRYRSLLSNNRMKPEDFEAEIAAQLLQGKLRQFLSTFSPVTEQEVLDQYTFSHEKVKISFVQFLPETFKDSVAYDETSMEAYFNEHKEQYRIPQKIKIAYIVFDPDDFRDQVKTGDDRIRDYYEENPEMFREEKQVRARHILFKLSQDAPEEEEKKVKEKARVVLEKVRQGEDFAALAKEYSEGPTRAEGGDLGFFPKGRMAPEFEETAFKMKIGETSDLVRTAFGYHIIRVEDIKEARTKSLEEVREEIADRLANMASMDLAHEKALSMIDQMPYDVDLGQHAIRHGMSVKESDFFSDNEAIPGIGDDEKLRQSIFSLEKNDVSELLEFGNKFYIVQVVDKKPSYLPESKEVSEKLKEDFISHLATLEAKSAAEAYLAELKEGKSWDDLARERKLEPKTSDFFTRNEAIAQIGYAPDIMEAVFSLGEKNRYPDTVFQNKKAVFVIRWEGSEGIDETIYQEDKTRYRYSLALAKHQAMFGDWLESLKRKADIQILQRLGS